MKLFNLHRVRLVCKNQIQSTACACLQEGVGVLLMGYLPPAGRWGMMYGVPVSRRVLECCIWGVCLQEGVGV